MAKELQIPPGYAAVLTEIKERVRPAQVRASFAVSRELVLLYWSIGREILVRQDVEGWGTKVIERLAKDLGVEFPGVEGFSPRNLKCMRSLCRIHSIPPRGITICRHPIHCYAATRDNMILPESKKGSDSIIRAGGAWRCLPTSN